MAHESEQGVRDQGLGARDPARAGDEALRPWGVHTHLLFIIVFVFVAMQFATLSSLRRALSPARSPREPP